MVKFTALLATFAITLTLPLLALGEEKDHKKMEPMLFHEKSDNGPWSIVNDTVMGGISSSSFDYTDEGIFIFRGNLSLENNGGFASVRSPLQSQEMEGIEAYRLRVKGDGFRYQLRFRVEGEWRWVSYSQGFDTKAGEWIEVQLPVEKFQAFWRGRRISEAPAFDPEKTIAVTLMATDKQEGDFQLEVDWINVVVEPLADKSEDEVSDENVEESN